MVECGSVICEGALNCDHIKMNRCMQTFTNDTDEALLGLRLLYKDVFDKSVKLVDEAQVQQI